MDDAWIDAVLAGPTKQKQVVAIARFATEAGIARLFSRVDEAPEPVLAVLEQVRVDFDGRPLADLYERSPGDIQDAIGRVLAVGHAQGLDAWLAERIGAEDVPPKRRGDLFSAVSKLHDRAFAEQALIEVLDRSVALAVSALARCGGAAAREALAERLKVPAWLGSQRRQVELAIRQIEARGGSAPGLRKAPADGRTGLEPGVQDPRLG